MSNPKTLLRIGVSGSVVAALCCFVPLLVILLGSVGLSAWVGYLDYVLLPELAACIALTLYALHQKDKAQACCMADSKMGERP